MSYKCIAILAVLCLMGEFYASKCKHGVIGVIAQM